MIAGQIKASIFEAEQTLEQATATTLQLLKFGNSA